MFARKHLYVVKGCCINARVRHAERGIKKCYLRTTAVYKPQTKSQTLNGPFVFCLREVCVFSVKP